MSSETQRSTKQRLCSAFLCLLDSFLSIVIFSPLVVGYWRGCWQLTDHYLLPKNKSLSVWTSFALGAGPGLFFCIVQQPMERVFDYKTRPKTHFVVSRLYTAVYCVISVNHWRGVWTAWDIYTGVSWISGVTSCAIGLCTLALTRGLINILAPPFLIVPDHPEGYFSVPTQFNAKVSFNLQ